jgi:hypothetical protein
MSSSKSVKSPTSVADVPTSVPLPFMLIRTWSRSGRIGPATVRVKKAMSAPFWSVNGGVNNQLLIVPLLVVLL